jgi:hypothetical protein
MDKKYNGFNNGRDRSDGVGGREVNHGTQETMTKEQILAQSLFEQLTQERELHQQQLSAERERAGKLVEAVQSFVQASDDFNIGYINRNGEITRCGIAALSVAFNAAEKRLRIALTESNKP